MSAEYKKDGNGSHEDASLSGSDVPDAGKEPEPEDLPLGYKDPGNGLFSLVSGNNPLQFWSIGDLQERAAAIAKFMPAIGEHPVWVALVRSVAHPSAGQLGIDLQARIGSEAIWRSERKSWSAMLSRSKRDLSGQERALIQLGVYNDKLFSAHHLLVTREFFAITTEHSRSVHLETLPAELPAENEYQRSLEIARSEMQKWQRHIRELRSEHSRMKACYDLDGKDFRKYERFNRERVERGQSRITRSEFFQSHARLCDPEVRQANCSFGAWASILPYASMDPKSSTRC